MSIRLIVWPALVFAAAWPGAIAAQPAAVASPLRHVSTCAPPPQSHDIIEPPNVDVRDLPLNDRGEHELILAVHRDGERFCYRYSWHGAVQTVPPAVHVRPGEHFALRIVNDIAGQSAGEHVAAGAIPKCMPMPMPAGPVVRYVGYLNHTMSDRYIHLPPLDTNIHLHGFQGPADQENVFLSTLSTPMHACEYSITIPRTQPPGTYFYHPHAHGMSRTQVAGGLSGAWIVDPKAPQLAPSDEHLIVLRYRLPVIFDNEFVPDTSALDDAAEADVKALKPGPTPAYNPFDPPPWPVSTPVQAGSVRLNPDGCDGVGPEPLLDIDGAATPASLRLPAGRTQLLRLVNATSDSPKALQLRDARGRLQALRVVALDGIPVTGDAAHPLARYVSMNQVMLSPSSRAAVLLTMVPGEELTLSSEHFCEGSEAFFQMRHELVRIQAATDGKAQPETVASVPVQVAQTPAARLVAFAHTHPWAIHRRAITFTEYLLPSVSKKNPAHLSYHVTDTTNPRFQEHSFWPVFSAGGMIPRNADVTVKAGTIEGWYLINTTLEAHAFHIHQMAFVLEHGLGGMPMTNDVVFVPVGKLMPNRKDPDSPLMRPSITKVLVDFRHVPRGTFVFHCHMLYHEDHGMMAIIRVI